MSPATFSPNLETSYLRRMIRQFHADQKHASDHSSNSARGIPLCLIIVHQRADRELAMVWNGNRHAAGVGAALHDDMTSPLTYLDEPVPLKDPADFASRQD